MKFTQRRTSQALPLRDRINYKKLLLLSVISLVFSGPALAEGSSEGSARLDTLISLDIEDLVTINVASKRDENIHAAPSIVNVISADEIKRYGGQNLADVVGRMTNMHMVSSAVLPNISASMRGASVNHIDNHILVLMNGRPIRDSFAGGYQP